MNPMTNVKNIKKLSEQELRLGNPKSSWHDQYKNSAWLFVGGLPYDLSEGDIICVFSQYGEVVNLNLVRDKSTGKSKGFCFLCYEDQRSTNLAVDNFNGIKILGRTIRVDHVSDYKPPKDSDKLDTDTRKLYSEGCAPKMALESEPELLPSVTNVKKEKKEKKIKVKKEKKRKKKKKKVKVQSSSSSSSESSSSDSDSDTDDSEESVRKRKQNRKKKSKSSKKRTQNSSSSDSDDADHKSAKTKRQQLEAKIKALEMALSTVKQSSKKAVSNDANSNIRSTKFKGDSVDNQRQCSSSDDHMKEKSRQQMDRRKHDYEFQRGEEMDSVKSKEHPRERADKERRSGREKSQLLVSRERTREKYKN